jgi:hypothetical protein
MSRLSHLVISFGIIILVVVAAIALGMFGHTKDSPSGARSGTPSDAAHKPVQQRRITLLTQKSADGQISASIEQYPESSQVFLAVKRSDQETLLAETPLAVATAEIAWSADSRSLAYLQTVEHPAGMVSEVWVLDVDTSEPRRVAQLQNPNGVWTEHLDVSWKSGQEITVHSPDTGRLFTFSREQVEEFTIETGEGDERVQTCGDLIELGTLRDGDEPPPLHVHCGSPKSDLMIGIEDPLIGYQDTGKPLTFAVEILNKGPDDADPFGFEVHFTGHPDEVTGPGCTYDPPRLRCWVDEGLDEWDTLKREITFIKNTPGDVTYQAEVDSSKVNDPQRDNNETDTYEVYCRNFSDWAVDITPTEPVFSGGRITYSVMGVNLGPDPVNGTQIVFNLPGEVSYVDGSATDGVFMHDGSATGGTLTWDIAGTLPGGKAAVLTVNADVQAGFVGDMVATASGTVTDPDAHDPVLANNSVESVMAVGQPVEPVIAGFEEYNDVQVIIEAEDQSLYGSHICFEHSTDGQTFETLKCYPKKPDETNYQHVHHERELCTRANVYRLAVKDEHHPERPLLFSAPAVFTSRCPVESHDQRVLCEQPLDSAPFMDGKPPSCEESESWELAEHDEYTQKKSLISTGAGTPQVMTMAFEGETLEVIYSTAPGYGYFTVEIDGLALRSSQLVDGQTISAAGPEQYRLRERINYLGDGPHIMRIIAFGKVNIDAFYFRYDEETPDLPGNPVIEAPKGLVAPEQAAHFSWQVASDATFYYLRISTPTELVRLVSADAVCNRPGYCDLILDTNFFSEHNSWRIIGLNESGYGEWVSADFTIGYPLPGVIKKTYPFEGEVIEIEPDMLVEFSWEDDPLATEYQLEVDYPQIESDVITCVPDLVAKSDYNQLLEAGDVCTDGKCKVTLRLPVVGEYQWRVRGQNSYGFGPWGPEGDPEGRSPFELKFNGSPGGIQPINPATDQIETDPDIRFEWQEDPDACAYEIAIFHLDNVDDKEVLSPRVFFPEQDYALLCENEVGCDVDEREVYTCENSGCWIDLPILRGQVAVEGDNEIPETRPARLAWYIRAVDPAGSTTDWNAGTPFELDWEISRLYPKTGEQEANFPIYSFPVPFRWKHHDAVTRYSLILLYLDGVHFETPSIPVDEHCEAANCVFHFSSSKIIDDKLNGEYTWQIAYFNDFFDQYWFTPLTTQYRLDMFPRPRPPILIYPRRHHLEHTDPPPLDKPTVGEPEELSVSQVLVTQPYVEFIWRQSPGPVEKYDVYLVNTDIDPSFVVLTETIRAENLTCPHARCSKHFLLPVDGNYRWYVTVTDQFGQTSDPAFADFKLETEAPTAPILSAPANGAALTDADIAFRWGEVADANWYQFEYRNVDEQNWTSETVSDAEASCPHNDEIPFSACTYTMSLETSPGVEHIEYEWRITAFRALPDDPHHADYRTFGEPSEIFTFRLEQNPVPFSQ